MRDIRVMSLHLSPDEPDRVHKLGVQNNNAIYEHAGNAYITAAHMWDRPKYLDVELHGKALHLKESLHRC